MKCKRAAPHDNVRIMRALLAPSVRMIYEPVEIENSVAFSLLLLKTFDFKTFLLMRGLCFRDRKLKSYAGFKTVPLHVPVK